MTIGAPFVADNPRGRAGENNPASAGITGKTFFSRRDNNSSGTLPAVYFAHKS
jgi:hypothetical protein